MYRLALTALLPFITTLMAMAQAYDPQVIAEQQQTLQNLLNNATVALRQNDQASACNL